MSIALIQSGPISAGNTDTLNVTEKYQVTLVRGDRRSGLVDRRLDLGQQGEGHADRRGTIPFAQDAATSARPPITPAGTWYQAA